MAFHRGYPVRSLNSLYRDLREVDADGGAGSHGGVLAASRGMVRDTRRLGEVAMERVIAGNHKQGRLMRIGSGSYRGERPGKGGRLETRVFKGSSASAYVEWVTWWSEVADPEMLDVKFSLAGKDWKDASAQEKARRLRERAESAKAGEPNAETGNPKAEPGADTKDSGRKPRRDVGADRSEEKGEGMAKQATVPALEKVYVLSYRNGRVSKLVAAYLSDTDALEMADALGTALEVSGADGEYTVDELPVRGAS